MKFIKTNFDVPYYNFALEEYLLKHAPEDDYFFFYKHKPSIIVGKHQNTIEELNKDYVDENGIVVARRLSGGGAVYHDDGNLNFSFVQNASIEEMGSFEKYTRPIIKALKALGVNAELSGRNDILIEGKKISGNAQCYKNNRILSHGTLLYNADLSKLSAALNVKDIKIKSKGVKSVRSRVTNIIEHLDQKLSIDGFLDFLFQFLINEYDAEEFILSDETMDLIARQADNKFATWHYVWGNSPEYAIQRIEKFPCGIIDVRLNVDKGLIKACKIYGDFFSAYEISELEDFLIGLKYDRASLRTLIDDRLISRYFKDLSMEDFVTFLAV